MAKDTPSTTLESVVSGQMPVRLTDPAEAALAIVKRIFSAQTAEEVLQMAGTMSADDVKDKPFVLDNVEFRKSDYQEGVPVYALMHCKWPDDGSNFVLVCGGSNVTAQVARLADLGALPRGVKLVQTERPTSNGFYPLWLTNP